jgi:uncharacterized cupin superfamily protein
LRRRVQEAPLKRTDDGLVPDGEGWFVLNAAEAPWVGAHGLGRAVPFESRDHRFGEFGLNIHRIEAGEPNCMYHSENCQEAFLVLAGEALLIVEGEERPLRQWDFVHFPPNTRHVVVGAGEHGALVLMAGTRKPEEEENLLYPAERAAQRHGAGVDEETPDAKQAYAGFDDYVTAYRPGDLPGA